jgi:hypothetical protein
MFVGSRDPHRRILYALEPQMARMGADGPALIIRDYPRSAVDPPAVHGQEITQSVYRILAVAAILVG